MQVMQDNEAAILTAELSMVGQFALAYAPARWRGAYATLFALDRRLGTIIAQANEPILAQMRLAWWRDRLSEPARQRPQGDVVLNAIGTQWQGHERALIALIDGWEYLLDKGSLSEPAITSFIDGHAAAWASLAARIAPDVEPETVSQHARIWALGDLNSRLSEEQERITVRTLAEPLIATLPSLPRLPRSLRPFAILSGLARHSLRNGGEPMMQSRRSILSAWRIGLAGR